MALAHPSDKRRSAPPSLARRHAVRAPQTASGGLRRPTQPRARRSALQSLAASGKTRLRYDRARRGALLPQSTPGIKSSVNCQASPTGSKALADPAVQAQAAAMMRSSLSPNGVSEYGFVDDPSAGAVGPLFTSNQQRQIDPSVFLGPSGAPIPGVPSSLGSYVFFHSHPNNVPPSPIDPGDRATADYFGFTIVAVDKSNTADCYDGEH